MENNITLLHRRGQEPQLYSMFWMENPWKEPEEPTTL